MHFERTDDGRINLVPMLEELKGRAVQGNDGKLYWQRHMPDFEHRISW